MKHRNPFMVLFLSIITFGIYDLYWLVKTKTVLNRQTKIHTPTAWLLFSPVILIVALFVVAFIVGVHQAPTQMTAGSNYTMTQDTTKSAGFTVVILLFDLIAFVVIIPITFYWFFKFSKAINEYTSSELNTGVTFLLLWLLHFIGVIIVQDKFNDMLEAGTISSDGSTLSAPAGGVAGPPGMTAATPPPVMPAAMPAVNPIIPEVPTAPLSSPSATEPVVPAVPAEEPSEPVTHAQDNTGASQEQPQDSGDKSQDSHDHPVETDQSTTPRQSEDDSVSVDSPGQEQEKPVDEQHGPSDDAHQE